MSNTSTPPVAGSSFVSFIMGPGPGLPRTTVTPSTHTVQTSYSTGADLVGHSSSTSASYFSSEFIPLTPPPSYDLSSSATLFSTSTLSRSPPQSTPPSTTSTPSTASPPSSSSTPYFSPTSTNLSSTPHSDVGIIAGAVAGSLAILASVTLILCFRRRKRKMGTGKDLDTRTRTFTLTPPEMASDRTEDRLPQPVISEMTSDPSQELPAYAPPQQMYGRLLADEKADVTSGLQAGNVERLLAHQESGVADDEDGPGSPGGSSSESISMASAPPSYTSEERVID